MLEVKIPGIRVGTAYAGEDLTKGTWVKASGTFSQGDLDTIHAVYPAQKNAAGFANVDSEKVMLAVLGDVLPCFPVNKLERQPEDADSNSIIRGEGVIYYVGGEYETDQFTSVSGTGAAFGDFLKIGASGKLVEEASATTKTTASKATVVRMTHGIDSLTGDVLDRLWFRMLSDAA